MVPQGSPQGLSKDSYKIPQGSLGGSLGVPKDSKATSRNHLRIPERCPMDSCRTHLGFPKYNLKDYQRIPTGSLRDP